MSPSLMSTTADVNLRHHVEWAVVGRLLDHQLPPFWQSPAGLTPSLSAHTFSFFAPPKVNTFDERSCHIRRHDVHRFIVNGRRRWARSWPISSMQRWQPLRRGWCGSVTHAVSTASGWMALARPGTHADHVEVCRMRGPRPTSISSLAPSAFMRSSSFMAFRSASSVVGLTRLNPHAPWSSFTFQLLKLLHQSHGFFSAHHRAPLSLSAILVESDDECRFHFVHVRLNPWSMSTRTGRMGSASSLVRRVLHCYTPPFSWEPLIHEPTPQSRAQSSPAQTFLRHASKRALHHHPPMPPSLHQFWSLWPPRSAAEWPSDLAGIWPSWKGPTSTPQASPAAPPRS